MRFPRSSRNRNDDERILPLTNIVFLLLIFFMLAGRLSAPDALAIQPPQSVSSAPAQPSPLTVQITAEGRIALNGKPVAPDDLEAAIRRRLVDQPALRVRLKADGSGDASRVVAVMGVLHDAGVERLRLLTTQASDT